jgi:hypothetical protein
MLSRHGNVGTFSVNDISKRLIELASRKHSWVDSLDCCWVVVVHLLIPTFSVYVHL